MGNAHGGDLDRRCGRMHRDGDKIMFTHFYSDPHYGHANIIKHANRPFDCVEDMDATLENNYECDVGADDFVLWLGDCTWDIAGLPALLAGLPGRKALVLGNHDRNARRMARCGFEFVVDRLQFELLGAPVIASHYPPRSTKRHPSKHDTRFLERMPQLGSGEVCIHGHTHEMSAVFGQEKRVHIGVDAWGFAPAPVDMVAGLVRRQSGAQ